jgi:hypothetical protein
MKIINRTTFLFASIMFLLIFASFSFAATKIFDFDFGSQVVKAERNFTATDSLLEKSTGSWSCDFTHVPATAFFGENNECYCIDTKENFGSDTVGYGNIAECLRTGKHNMSVLFGSKGGGAHSLQIAIDYDENYIMPSPLTVSIKTLSGQAANSSSSVVCDIGVVESIGTADVIYTYYKRVPHFTLLKRSYSNVVHLANLAALIGVGDEIACQASLYDGTSLLNYAESSNTVPIGYDIPLDVTYAYISPAYPTFNETLHCTGYANYANINALGFDTVEHTYNFYANGNLIGSKIWNDTDFTGQGRNESFVGSEVERGDEVKCDYSAQLINAISGDRGMSDFYSSRTISVVNSKPSKPEVAIYVS